MSNVSTSFSNKLAKTLITICQIEWLQSLGYAHGLLVIRVAWKTPCTHIQISLDRHRQTDLHPKKMRRADSTQLHDTAMNRNFKILWELFTPLSIPQQILYSNICSLKNIDLLPTSRTKVMEQSPLISENSGYETIQIYR
jgi:hypothetical protein